METNEFCQTNIENVYAVGNVAGGLLAYAAQSIEDLTAENVVKGNFVAADNFIVPQAAGLLLKVSVRVL